MYTNNLLISFKNNIAAITSDGKSITYGDIYDFSNSIYNKIGHRCLIFTLCQNNTGSLCGIISFLVNKVVPLLLDSIIDKELLDNLIKIYKPEYLWIPVSREIEFPENEVIYSVYGYSLIKLENDNPYKLNSQLAILLTTSGSTGSPKLVRITCENLEANARSIGEYLAITSSDRPITTMPMNYSFGLSIINSHLNVGATILLTSKSLMEKEFWTFLKKENATSISGVPYTFEILAKLRFFQMDLPALKTITQAGGKLNAELTKEFADYCFHNKKRFYVMYGQTEATARISYLAPEFAKSKIGSIGKAIPGGELVLMDENNNPVGGPEISGELVYKGKNVSMGYAECGDDLDRGDQNNGTLFTGDIAKKDEDNFYYLIGRKKRFIKLFGNRINMDEIETILKNILPDCACIGEDDKLVIYVTDISKESEIREYLSRKTGINKVAFCIRQIDKIPKNNVGKTTYSDLSML